jgi:flagellar protein FliL
VIVLVIVVALVCVAGGGGAAWWWFNSSHADASNPAEPEASEPAEPAPLQMRAHKYVTLDKVIVMLRNDSGDPVSHYLALDLVFVTPTESEKITENHLPLLRSVTVKELSELTLQSASHLSVDELSARINEAFTRTYAGDVDGKPFVEAMIGKLIIE